jgi:uncharacterized protein (DUF1330 family)
MSIYMIAHVKLTDDAWVPDYAAKVHHIVHKHGGKYLARSANITNLEGEPPDSTVIGILEFPTLDDARAFVSDPEYAPLAAARRKGSVAKFYAIDNTDAVGTIPYLQKP